MKDGKNAYLLLDPKYRDLLAQVLDKKTSFEDVVKQLKALSDSCKPIWPFKNEFAVRVPALKLDIYLQHLFDI